MLEVVLKVVLEVLCYCDVRGFYDDLAARCHTPMHCIRGIRVKVRVRARRLAGVRFLPVSIRLVYMRRGHICHLEELGLRLGLVP